MAEKGLEEPFGGCGGRHGAVAHSGFQGGQETLDGRSTPQGLEEPILQRVPHPVNPLRGTALQERAFGEPCVPAALDGVPQRLDAVFLDCTACEHGGCSLPPEHPQGRGELVGGSFHPFALRAVGLVQDGHVGQFQHAAFDAL